MARADGGAAGGSRLGSRQSVGAGNAGSEETALQCPMDALRSFHPPHPSVVLVHAEIQGEAEPTEVNTPAPDLGPKAWILT